MQVTLREDESGVSEVVGTILILAMTVVLFSAIILWVSAIPTPVAQTRLDIQGTLTPICAVQGPNSGYETGFNATLLHNGGESLTVGSTAIYVTYQYGSTPASTDSLSLHMYRPAAGGATSSGLLDGTGSVWSIGEHWSYQRVILPPNIPCGSVTVSVIVVDTSRSTVVWSAQLSPLAGQRPPVFLNVWASREADTSASNAILPVQSGVRFFLMAQISDPDGDLNSNNVWATFTVCNGGRDQCALPQRMSDNGAFPDVQGNDGIFTIGPTWLVPSVGWDNSIVLLNATDMKGHMTTTRFTLHVEPGPTGGTTSLNPLSPRLQNLLWNGNQGYNIFSGINFDAVGIVNATPTRSIRSNDSVVIVVGSLSLENLFGADSFNLFDPYSGVPPQSVVYGQTKTVTSSTCPSSTQAFSFYTFAAGYYIYIYRFNLNDASSKFADCGHVGANFYNFGSVPRPPNYYFARYPLSVFLQSGTGNKFTMTDSVNITSTTGSFQQFPSITTYKDASFSPASQTTSFRSTQVVYVKVQMYSADTIISNVKMGNVIIQDYSGDTQLWRAPISGYQSNMPICQVTGVCAAGSNAITSSSTQNTYFFEVNLSRTNQDPWVAGAQSYAFQIQSIQDSDESYGATSLQLSITAPLYKMDVIAGTQDATTNSWGTNNYLYYFENFNGFDWWKSLRVDYCQGGGSSTSGIPGNGVNCPTTSSGGYVRSRFGNFFNDGTLGVAESISTKSGTAVQVYRRGVDASGSVIYLPVFNAPASQALPEACNALGVGDLTGTGLQSVICAGVDGKVWYYRNDGNWSFIWVDQAGSGRLITSISVGDFNGDGGNDVAVSGSSGFVAVYPNLDKRGTFQNPGFQTNQPAVGETSVYGSTVGGTTYLNTYPSAVSPEILQEQQINVILQRNTTVNPSFDAGTTGWAYADWTDPGTYASGGSLLAGGNPGGYVYVSASCLFQNAIAGYWYQRFSVYGSPPFAPSTVSLDWSVPAYGGASSVTLYAFVDAVASAPILGTEVWSQTLSAASPTWASVSGVSVTNRIIAPGTYYLKIAVRAVYGATCAGATIGAFDNVQLAWSSTPGPTSALEHYWYLGTMPARPNITFNFILRAQGTYSGDFDNYTFAYSTNVAGNNPSTGTYTPMYPPYTLLSANVSVGTNPPPVTDANISLPATIANLPVWIRVLDTNRVVNSLHLDNLTVSRLYINTFTQTGSTVILLSGPTSLVTSSNAGDQNGDGVSDLVVGTSIGTVYLFLGSRISGIQLVGTLLTPTALPLGVVSVKFGNITSAYPGLEVVAATSATVYLINVNGRATFGNPLTPNRGNIQAMATGDLNGDGMDDVVVGTSTGYVLGYYNFGGGYAWSYGVLIFNAGSQVYYNLAIGDASNYLYMGR